MICHGPSSAFQQSGVIFAVALPHYNLTSQNYVIMFSPRRTTAKSSAWLIPEDQIKGSFLIHDRIAPLKLHRAWICLMDELTPFVKSTWMGGLVLSELCVLSLQLIKHMAPGCLSVNSSSGQQTKPTSSAAGSLASHTPLLKHEQQRIQPDFSLCFKLKTSAGQNSKSLPCMVATLAFHKVVILSRNDLIYQYGCGPAWIRCRLF